MNKRVPLLLATISGLVPILSSVFSTPGNQLQTATDSFERALIIISGFALLLGVVNVLQNNLKKISKRASGWPYALALLVGLFLTAILGLNQAFTRSGPGVWRWGELTAFEWIQDAGFKPLQATMFSLLAFYIASAAFRAFRVRNVEATILLVSAMVVMMGINPYGLMLFGWLPEVGGKPFVQWLTDWVLDTPNSAAQRGIIIGAALGAAAMSLRVLLGIERSYLGLGQE
jgi:hypothetical protein